MVQIFKVLILGVSFFFLLSGCMTTLKSGVIFASDLSWVQSEEIITFRRKEEQPDGVLTGYLEWVSANGAKKGRLQEWKYIVSHPFPIMVPENPERKGMFIRTEGDRKEYMYIEDVNLGTKRLVLAATELKCWVDDSQFKWGPKPSYSFNGVHWLNDGKYIVFATRGGEVYILDPFWRENGEDTSKCSTVIGGGWYPNIDRMFIYGYPVLHSVLRGYSTVKSDQLTKTNSKFLSKHKIECNPDPSNKTFYPVPLGQDDLFEEKLKYINANERKTVRNLIQRGELVP